MTQSNFQRADDIIDVTIFEGWVLIGVNSTIGVTLDLDEAEAFALALLAAIKHQKENRHES